jgi:alpha-tubulin suppressor-like RCC1 family protein
MVSRSVTSHLPGWVRAGFTLALVGAAIWAGACTDYAAGPESENPNDTLPPGDTVAPLPQGMIVSDPVPTASLAAQARAAPAPASGAGDRVAYVSLGVGTVPAGSRAVVRRVGEVATLTTAVVGGGFDPVPVTAAAGDSIEVVVMDVGGTPLLTVGARVRPTRPPIVVRTDPPKDNTDVPINASVVIVFSEPVAGGSLTPSTVQLFRGTTQVAGTASLLQGSAAAAVFTPAAPLAANTSYRLEVTQGVRDLGGDALAGPTTLAFTTGSATVGSATRVAVFPDTAAVAIGSQVQLTPSARDTAGIAIVGRPFAWTSDNPVVATVSATGLVTALAEGVALVTAELDGRRGSAAIVVSAALAPVASVTIVPESATVLVGGLVRLDAVLRDTAGNILPFRPVSWQSSNSAIASVSSGSGSGTAIVTRVASGEVTVTATSEGRADTATIKTGTVGPYAQISAGSSHTCAVTTAASAWCWGALSSFGTQGGVLGNGTILPTLAPSVVAGGLTFAVVTAGSDHSCGLTTSGDAYCWGWNAIGQLGIDTAPPGEAPVCTPIGSFPCWSLEPVAVAGGLRFSSIEAQWGHTCALTPGGVAYCWGRNLWGSLGTGTLTGPEVCPVYREPCSTVPAAVAGGLTFTSITVGDYHTCALTTSGAAYCWGRGDNGLIGDGTNFDRSSPTQVAGGLAFVALTAGESHTCALTSDGSAYCWGGNAFGQLGIGTTIGPEGPCRSPTDPNRDGDYCSTVPVRVSGDLRFASISAGGQQTCALTPGGVAYCWGRDWLSESVVTTPAAVAGGTTFARLSVGGSHSCGVTAQGVAYCWGANGGGVLGNGTTTSSAVPVRVAGQP